MKQNTSYAFDKSEEITVMFYLFFYGILNTFKEIYINYQLLCTDYYLFIKY